MSQKKIDDVMQEVVMSEELKGKIRRQTTQKKKVVGFRRNGMKKVVIAATISVAMLGTMTAVASNNIEKIEQYLADAFHLDKRTQKKLAEGGFVQDMDVTKSNGDEICVTKNGVTITVKQTIADKRTLRILLHVKSENGMELSEYDSFGRIEIAGVPEDHVSYMSEASANNPRYERWYMIEADCSEIESNYAEKEGIKNGTQVELSLKDIISGMINPIKTFNPYETDEVVLNQKKYQIKIVENADIEELIDPLRMEQENCETVLSDAKGTAYVVYPVDDEEEEVIGEDGREYLVIDEEGNMTICTIGTSTPLVEAEWKLTWKITANEQSIDIPVNKIIEANGIRYHIEYLQLTPLSFKAQFLERAEVIDEQYVKAHAEEMSIQDYIRLDVQFVMKDGSTYELPQEAQGCYGYDGEWIQLEVMLDLENVEKVIVEGQEFPVK